MPLDYHTPEPPPQRGVGFALWLATVLLFALMALTGLAMAIRGFVRGNMADGVLGLLIAGFCGIVAFAPFLNRGRVTYRW
jgi:hypothetical protein